DAQAGVTSVTNAIVGAPVPSDSISGGFVPTLGPRWTLDGCLNVKGRGGQEFVVNGLDAAALKRLRVDGVTLKVVSDDAAALEELTLGAPAGGLIVASADSGASRQDVSIVSLSVGEGGIFDATMFDPAHTLVQDMSFSPNSTLCVRGNPARAFSVSGTLTLPSALNYLVPPKTQTAATVLTAGNVAAPEGGVVWTQLPTTRTRRFRIGRKAIEMMGYGMTVTVR
ncbi:MAG: hypothetical protein SPG40_01420, partial [Kiritimatiellia bacterium]|nr:hypothetical protein [Kiritimatiellia bacterium]